MSLLLLIGDQITGATATEPEVRTEIDFVPGVATDVSDDLMAFNFTRGKQRELDRFQAGRGSVVLANSDRRYDPSYVFELDTLGFEGNTIGQWVVDPNFEGIAAASTDFALSGTHSMKVTLVNDDQCDLYIPVFVPTLSPGLWPFNQDCLRCTSGRFFRFQSNVYVPNPGVETITVEFRMNFYDRDGNSVDGLLLETETISTGDFDEWHLIDLYDEVPSGAVFAEPYIIVAATSDTPDIVVYFDDFVFENFYNKIKPQRRIRIPVNYAGTTHMLFEGYIDSWDQVRRGPHTGDAVVNFTDGFKVLNKATLESSAYVTEVLADSPVAFWRLDESSGTTKAFDSISDLHLDVVGTPEFGEQSLISREPGTGVLMTSSTNQQIRKQVFGELPTTGAPITVEIVFQRTSDGADGCLIGQTCTSLTNGMFALLTSSTVVAAQAVNGVNGQQLATSTGVNFDDNLIHHVVARWDTDGSIRIFVDGVNVTNGTPSLATTAFTDTSGFVGIGTDVFSDVDTGVYQMGAIYNTALSDARIAAHAACVTTPWNNDTPAARVNRVLDAIGWDSTRRDLDTGASVLQSATLGNTALEHSQKVGESEFGKLFIDKHGNVRLVARESQWNQTAVATFTDDASYVSSDPEYTDELLRNDVTVSRSEGVAQNWKDQDSIDEYLINSYTADGLYHDDDDLSLYAAQYIVDVYKDPLLRISSLTFTPNGNPSVLFPILLGMELGDWVVVEETPQNYGATTVHTCVVEGISFNWSPKVWSVTLNLSPADTRAYWMAGVEGYSNAGVSTRAGF